MRVHDVNFAFSNDPPQLPRGARIYLRCWTALDDVEARRRRSFRQGLAAARGNQANVPAASKLRREPQRLTLAAAPASFGVDVQYSDSHGAQHPPADVRTQGAE
jgi:hypothetical protein